MDPREVTRASTFRGGPKAGALTRSRIPTMASFRADRCPLSADTFTLLRAGNVVPAIVEPLQPLPHSRYHV